MLSKDKVRLQALRSIKSLILLAESSEGNKGELSQETEIKLLQKAAKQRKESGEIYKAQGRTDLADIEFFELGVIEGFLPKQLSHEELKSLITEIISKTGATSQADFGKVMGTATKELAGKADGKTISQLVKELLLKI